MMLKGRVLIVQLSTRKHRDETLAGTSSVVIPLEMMKCLNKKSSFYWEIKSQLYIMPGERSTMRI
jgi:hypothetical protein